MGAEMMSMYAMAVIGYLMGAAVCWGWWTMSNGSKA